MGTGKPMEIARKGTPLWLAALALSIGILLASLGWLLKVEWFVPFPPSVRSAAQACGFLLLAGCALGVVSVLVFRRQERWSLLAGSLCLLLFALATALTVALGGVSWTVPRLSVAASRASACFMLALMSLILALGLRRLRAGQLPTLAILVATCMCVLVPLLVLLRFPLVSGLSDGLQLFLEPVLSIAGALLVLVGVRVSTRDGSLTAWGGLWGLAAISLAAFAASLIGAGRWAPWAMASRLSGLSLLAAFLLLTYTGYAERRAISSPVRLPREIRVAAARPRGIYAFVLVGLSGIWLAGPLGILSSLDRFIWRSTGPVWEGLWRIAPLGVQLLLVGTTILLTLSFARLAGITLSWTLSSASRRGGL